MSYPESAYGGQVEEEATSSDGTFSVIDRYSSFDGTFTADRDLRIDGVVKGTIECRGTLLVAEGATVEATVDAENIAIAGELNGEIRCVGRLQLLPTGRLSGNVSTTSLVISEGAIYEGDLAMEEPVPSQNGDTPPLSTVPQVGETPGIPETEVPVEQPVSEQQPDRVEETVPTTFIRRKGGSETPWSADRADERPESEDSE